MAISSESKSRQAISGKCSLSQRRSLLINCPKMLLGNARCLARDSGPSSLVKVLFQSDSPLRQRVV
jgi:hypothetical protein